MKRIAAIPLLLISFNLKAQRATDSIKLVINQMFYAMKNSDSVGIMQCFTVDAFMQTFASNKEGNIIVKTNTVVEFATTVSKLPKDSVDERITFETIQQDGPLASVWTPYNLYMGNKFIHCGTNHFVLARLNGIWKIQYIIDTRRKIGCGR